VEGAERSTNCEPRERSQCGQQHPTRRRLVSPGDAGCDGHDRKEDHEGEGEAPETFEDLRRRRATSLARPTGTHTGSCHNRTVYSTVVTGVIEMALADTARRRLHERALDRYGYVTTRDAAEVGVAAVELRKIAQRGGVKHVSYGLYRFDDIPRTGKDELMEAVLRVGEDAFLTHDSVLALHDLAMVNPRRIRVGTPHRVRPQLPVSIEVIRQDLGADELTVYDGIASATVARALEDCRETVITERLIDATREATKRGLVRRRDSERLLTLFGATP
jgi:hypothetical protein